MKYAVVASFRDKHTNEVFTIGSFYETEDKDRVTELRKGGFLGDEIQSEQPYVLKQNVAGVKAAITEDLPKEQLEALLQEEKEGENRKGVIEHIEALLKGDSGESGKTE